MKTATTKETLEQLLIPLEFSRFSNEPKTATDKAEPLSFSIETPRNPKTGAEMKQPRFANRQVIKPNIRLGDYRVKAVIDWIQFEVGFNLPTQSRWLSEKLGEVLGRNPRVTEKGVPYYANGNPRYTGRQFWIKIEEPTPEIIEAVQLYLNSRAVLLASAKIVGIELSLDFYPKDQTDQKRWEMVTALKLLHNPTILAMKNPLDNLRQVVSGSSPKRRPPTQFIVSRTGKSSTSNNLGDGVVKDEGVQHRILNSKKHQTQYIDATGYLGQRGGDIMFRYQNKITDNRSADEGGSERLCQREKRARLEVTLLGSELQLVGLNRVGDLNNFNFAKLGNRYFPFSLPLVGSRNIKGRLKHEIKSANDARSALKRSLNIEMFSKSGMYGFLLRHDVLRAKRKELRLTKSKRGGKLTTELSKKTKGQNNMQWKDANNSVFEAFKGLSKK